MTDRPRNRLLRSLSQAALDRLQPSLERVDLPLKRYLFEPNEPITSVYFIEEGVGSIVADQQVVVSRSRRSAMRA